jgi:hypothetical protein
MKKHDEWHWLLGGFLVSILSLFSYFVFEAITTRTYPFGVTAGFGFIGAWFGKITLGLNDNPVIKKFTENPDGIIEFFILIGLILGGYTASKLSGNFSTENIPSTWEKHVTKSKKIRYMFVIVGSIFLGYGAAFSGGCTTGNILQGWAHLSLGSIVAGISFFVGAIIASRLIYSKFGGKNVD